MLSTLSKTTWGSEDLRYGALVTICLAALAMLCVADAEERSVRPAACWPRFRGIDGAGVEDSRPLPTTWSKKDNVMWKADLPGKGWSSPIVWGNRVFITTAIPEGKVEAPWVPEKMEDNGKGYPTTVEQRWTVICLDLRTGKKLWQREAARAVPNWLTHPKGSHASETPATDGERVYALFGGVGVFCYTVDGKPLWSRKWGPSKMLFNWGTAIGPEAADGRVIVVNDNEESSWLLCLDAKNGKEVWQVKRDEKSNWCNPLVWKHAGRTEIVTAGSRVVRSYDMDGKLLWELKGMSYATIPSPFVYHDRLYIASGHASGPITPIYCIKPGAEGDISLKEGETINAWVSWRDAKAGPYVPTPIAYRDLVYSLRDSGVLMALAEADGKAGYRARIARGPIPITASPVAGDGKVYCLGEKGNMAVVEAGPEFKVLATNDLGEDTLATPAIADGSLLIRTLNSLYRIGTTKTAKRR